jgi:hypothetical protein
MTTLLQLSSQTKDRNIQTNYILTLARSLIQKEKHQNTNNLSIKIFFFFLALYIKKKEEEEKEEEKTTMMIR